MGLHINRVSRIALILGMQSTEQKKIICKIYFRDELARPDPARPSSILPDPTMTLLDGLFISYIKAYELKIFK